MPKKTIRDIRSEKKISLGTLAGLAHLSRTDLFNLELGYPYSRAEIERVLAALSLLTGEQYTPHNVGGFSFLSGEGPPAQKLSFVQLLNNHSVTMVALARVARISRAEVYAMAVRTPVAPEMAERVLAALRALVGASYTLEDVDIVVW